MTKAQYDLLDQFGVGQTSPEELRWRLPELRAAAQAAVAIIPFSKVVGLEGAPRPDGWYFARLLHEEEMRPYAWVNKRWNVGEHLVGDALFAEIGPRIPTPEELAQVGRV